MSIEELRQDMFKQLIEMGYAFLDAGMVFITAVRGLSKKEADQLKIVTKPFETVIINLETATEFSDIVYTKKKVDKTLIDTIKTKIKKNK